MMGPAEVFIALIIVGLPVILLMIIANRFFRLREKKLEVEASMAAEKAAQYASRSHELEARVRVLEQIVTDNGAQTAAQIEALRSAPRRVQQQKVASEDPTA
jgi:predicted negative regulator of RcsB-dependent stress response